MRKWLGLSHGSIYISMFFFSLLLLLRPPFHSTEPQKIYSRIMDGVFSFPAFVSEAACSLVAKLCRYVALLTFIPVNVRADRAVLCLSSTLNKNEGKNQVGNHAQPNSNKTNWRSENVMENVDESFNNGTSPACRLICGFCVNYNLAKAK